ncbi:MAG: hypothetical protein AVDCRST_MAG64-1387, partial [uncultured Phycisphaerae bacterium]
WGRARMKPDPYQSFRIPCSCHGRPARASGPGRWRTADSRTLRLPSRSHGRDAR